jgi:hypothetical protein
MSLLVILIGLALTSIEAKQFIEFRKSPVENLCGNDPLYISCFEVKFLFLEV